MLKTASLLMSLALCSAGAMAAPAKTAGKAPASYSTNVKFVLLNNSHTDPSFNEKIFKGMLLESINRAGIAIDGEHQVKGELAFEVDYVYRAGEVDYRFLTLRTYLRNKKQHAICYNADSVWWGGPSGAAQIPSTVQAGIDSFLRRCAAK